MTGDPDPIRRPPEPTAGDATPAQPPPKLPLPYAAGLPPRTIESEPTTDLAHAAAGAGTYLSLLVAIKVAAVRYHWDVGGVCGAWVLLLAASLAVSGWLAGAHGWRGALVGTVVAMVASLLFSALVLREW